MPSSPALLRSPRVTTESELKAVQPADPFSTRIVPALPTSPTATVASKGTAMRQVDRSSILMVPDTLTLESAIRV